jgi:hypothetical protein
MTNRVVEIFEDEKLVQKIQRQLPYLFQLAELESSRAGKVGMEVGTIREKVLIALLIYRFGAENVETDIPITEPEVDVKLFGEPINIKTITGLGGVKIIWTVDSEKAIEFRKTYAPKCDMLLALIRWKNNGGLYYISFNVQKKVFEELGRNGYLNLPKPGTNPRGVELSKEALVKLLKNKGTKVIHVSWVKQPIKFNAYERWVDLWRQDITPRRSQQSLSDVPKNP